MTKFVKIDITLPNYLYKKLVSLAEEKCMTLSEVANEAMREYLKAYWNCKHREVTELKDETYTCDDCGAELPESHYDKLVLADENFHVNFYCGPVELTEEEQTLEDLIIERIKTYYPQNDEAK